ncbi:MAG: beta-lactamase hydrolase domain-containing protein [Stenotrophomonas sp.]|uniref:beta-lactamase hydrolase domain-containing protein n=1 Tax=Stenotrophomonas sp. TaxID=69392 RepID=UPI003D6D7D61
MRCWNRPAFFIACVMCMVWLPSVSSGAEPRSTARGPVAHGSDAGRRSTPDGSDGRLVERGPASLAETDLSTTFKNPAEGLYTSGQPTAEHLQQAAAAGITTLIDLRQPGEDRGFDETATAAALGLNYVRIPVAGAAGLTPANVQALQAALTKANGPVLLHCASGNRVGALLALMKAQHGVPAEEALQFGRNAGMTSLEAQTRALLEQDATR